MKAFNQKSGSGGILFDHGGHGVELLLHVLHQLELGAAAVQVLLGIVDAEVVVAVQIVGQEADTALQGHHLGAHGHHLQLTVGEGGAGGEEAALFAAVLYRMYSMYGEKQGWKTEILNLNETELGGYKEISFMINGDGAYSRLKYESGVHRVQRVPDTESQGRIHTSTVTVAVLPEAKNIQIDINEKDLQIDYYRAGGAGGQYVNKTESAVRITHLPTGIVVQSQDERSQHHNKDKCMAALRSRLLENARIQEEQRMGSARKVMIGSGDRSERIRTYNFPQNRLTDHRINLTLYSLDRIMEGLMEELITALVESNAELRLKAELGRVAGENN